MKKIVIISMLMIASFLLMSGLSQAADEWGYPTVPAPVPPAKELAKVKVTATLTYTDPSTGRTITKSYKPTVSDFKIARDYDGALDASDQKTTLSLTDSASSMHLSVSASGSGVTAGTKTDIVCALNEDMETANDPAYPAFAFSATDVTTSTSLSMNNSSMIAITTEGSYTEVPSKTLPVVTSVTATVKYIIMGAVTVGSDSYPAKILVQLSGSRIQPKP